MDFSMIGSVHNYAKSLKLQTKWEQKKQSGDVTSHQTSASDWISQMEETEHGDSKLKDIMTKIYAGGKLTEDEKEYLRTKDPEAYQELENQEQEQKAYERELRKCKTKEDVQRLKTSRLGASLSRIKSVENNPNIGVAKKLEICLREKLKCDKFEQSTEAFVRKGEYAKLPTEAEEAKAEKELRESVQAKKNPDAQKPENSHQTEESPQQRPDKAAAHTEDKAASAKSEDTGKTYIEVESPEMRKVRRAKAKAAYTAPPDLPNSTPTISLNIKA